VGGHICKWYIPRVTERVRPTLSRNVIALAAVSFFTDVSSEMIYPLLPVFLTGTLGASASLLGVIEGAAESTASLLKLASGWWSDRLKRRKPLVVLGYTLAAVARPLIAVAQSAGHVLAIRLTDRVGKGIRTSPRDALIADSTDPTIRGRAFGFHRAADHAGAVIGPLTAFVLLQTFVLDLRTVFWIAAIPGAAALLTVWFLVHEVTPARRDDVIARAGTSPVGASATPMPRSFWSFLVIVFVFTLGNSTDAFLLVRASQLGVPLALIPILWAALHLVKSVASTPGGALSDRIGRVPTLMAGWGIYALVYVGFAFAAQAWHAWALFILYGLFFALTEGTEKALVADLVSPERRGTAFGWFNLTIGVGALPASLLFGLVWDRAGAPAAFGLGAALAAVAAVSLALVPGARAVQQQR
jgi:MFS family permease